MKRSTRFSLLVLGLLITALPTFSQVKWLPDASEAQIPDSPLAGTINKSAFSFKHGTLDKTGYFSADEEILFEHFTVSLRDHEKFWLAKFAISFTVTVKKNEMPDGKTFRRLPNSTPAELQPRLGDRFTNVPEFLSLSMEGPSDFPKIGTILSGPIGLSFSGRVSFGARKNGSMPVSMYLCFDDSNKSCIAGKAEVDILIKEDET